MKSKRSERVRRRWSRARWGLIGGLLLALSSTRAAEAPAQRVVTLAPHLAELVCAVGGCARLVGVGAYSDYPASVKALPQVGDAFRVNAEAVLALHPDLVLSWTGGTPAGAIEPLRRIGLRVEGIESRSVDDVAEALKRVGALLGTEAQARVAAEDYRRRLATLRERHRTDAPIRIVYQIETAPAYTVNGDSPISAALAICGGVNVFAKLPTLSASISAESMLAAQPEAVLYGGEENAAAMRAYWSRLAATPAQRRGALYAIDANLLARASPRLLDGIEQVCRVLDQARARRASVP